jgi:hypothetical protein
MHDNLGKSTLASAMGEAQSKEEISLGVVSGSSCIYTTRQSQTRRSLSRPT